MLESPFLNHKGTPGDEVFFLLQRFPLKAQKLRSLRIQNRDFSVFEKHDPLSVVEKRIEVRGDEILSFSQTHNRGRADLRHDNLSGIQQGYDRDRKRPFNLLDCFLDSLLQGSMKVFFHQMGDHFCICFRPERVLLLNEFLLESQIILDDPVMNNDE
ncbi:hypothetical protein ES703_20656 [subsurface metagenome]